MSAITEDSGKALIYTMIIYTLFAGLIPILMSTPAISDLVVGQAPEMPDIAYDQMSQGNGNNPELELYQQQIREYSDKRMAFMQTLSLFSPTGNYQKITLSLTNPTVSGALYGQTIGEAGSGEQGADIPGLLSMLSVNIIALILLPVAFLGIAYVRFMRTDIR
jgi:ABC-2 type transport system permease protein